MLNEKLRQKSYYLEKLPLFLRNSYGVEDQVHIYWSLLTDQLTTIDDLFSALALEYDGEYDDTLDKLAELVGAKRSLDVKYKEAGTLKEATLHLNNRELVRFIRTRIMQNNYFGGFEQLQENYQRLGLNVFTIDSASGAGIVDHVLNDDLDLTENDKKMFLSGHYTIRSVGIIYQFTIGTINMIGSWDNAGTKWNVQHWGE